MKTPFWLLVFIALLYTPSLFAASNSDPRFFGVYCGEHKACREVKVGAFGYTAYSKTVCKDVENIILRLDYTETAKGGLVHGSGTAKVDGDELHLVIAGVVVSQGVFRGSTTVSGLGNRAGWAYLSEGGTEIKVNAQGERIELSKFECNNTYPQVAITVFPASPVSFGQLMFFRGEATDTQDNILFPPERLVWKSDNTIVLQKSSDGLRASTNTLSPGDHTITFTATDHGGLTSTDSIQVTVVNKPPDEPFINSPADGDTVTAGCDIFFKGGAYDQEDTFITGPNLVWSSSIDGMIGTGAELKDKLNSPGTHLVRLTASDSVGESSIKVHTVNVNPSTDGCPPTVKIASPTSEFIGPMVIFSPQNITFVGSAEDSEDTPDTLQYKWKLKPISPAGTEQIIGNSIVAEEILFEASGANKLFEITFQVTDTDGNTAEDKMELYVLSQPIL
jgi:hypothetical protein